VQSGYGLWSDFKFFPDSLESLISIHKAMFTFSGAYKNDIYEWSGEQLRVNTSLFVWWSLCLHRSVQLHWRLQSCDTWLHPVH